MTLGSKILYTCFTVSAMPPRSTAHIERHFNITGDSSQHNLLAKCKYCESTFSCSSSRLIFHIACLPGNGIKPCPTVSPAIRGEVRNQIQKQSANASSSDLGSTAPSATTHESDASGSRRSLDVIDLEAFRPPKQRKLEEFFEKTAKEAAHRAWAQFFYAEGIPMRKS